MNTRLSRRAALCSLALAACGRSGDPGQQPARSSTPLIAESPPAQPSGPTAPAAGFALVELFSSEGCSSCPPADRLLAELVGEGDERVFPLAFQVDYWDSLGWTDPYGSPGYTSRQQEYAQKLGLSGLYTPQAVVNGRDEFVGSDRGKLRAALARALARPPAVSVALGEARAQGGRWAVPFRLEGDFAGARVFTAAVQRGAESDVRRGENAGQKLRHEAVVRALENAPAQPSGEASVAVVPGATWLVVWVQKPGREVLGAARLTPPRAG